MIRFTGLFQTNAPKRPENDIGHYRVRGTLYMSYWCPRIPISSPFHSRASRFWGKRHFENSAPNDPKMTWILQGQRYTTYVLLVSLSTKCQSAFVHGQPFLNQRSFWENCTEWIALQGQMYAIYVLLVSTCPKFHCFVLRAVFEIHAILRQTHWMTITWPWTCKQGQMYPICMPSVSEFQISVLFALQPAIFGLQAILGKVHWMTQNNI